MDCMRLVGGCSLLFPKRSSSSLSLRASISSKVKLLALKAARYFFTVFRDASVWAAMVIMGRCWLYILKIFLILLMLIVELAMFGGICCLRKMVASTAFATRSGWSVCPGIPWSVCPGIGGQLAPESGGLVHQNLQKHHNLQIGKLLRITDYHISHI